MTIHEQMRRKAQQAAAFNAFQKQEARDALLAAGKCPDLTPPFMAAIRHAEEPDACTAADYFRCVDCVNESYCSETLQEEHAKAQQPPEPETVWFDYRLDLA
jgi:hypothetical protein